MGRPSALWLLPAAVSLLLFVSGYLVLSSAGPRTVGPDAPFRLRIGERAGLRSTGISVAFLNVTGDSRCPSGEQCAEAGSVRIVLGIYREGRLDTVLPFVLGFGDSRKSDSAAGRDFIVTAVEPRPVTGRTTPLSRYSVTLIIADEGSAPDGPSAAFVAK